MDGLTEEQKKALEQAFGGSSISPNLERSLIELSELLKQPEPDTQRIRSIAQGLTFNTADEAEAAIMSAFTGRPYSESVKEVRTKLQQYKEARPGEALLYEMGGAALPVIASTVMSGGAGTVATTPYLARFGKLLFSGPGRQGTIKANIGAQAMYGGAQGALSGFGAAEGSPLERINPALMSGLTGFGTGGILSAGGTALQKPAGRFSEFVRNRLAGRGDTAAVNEFRRLVAQTFPGQTVDNLSPEQIDQFVADIASGLIAAENKDIVNAARAYNVGPAGTVMREGLEARPEAKRTQAYDFMVENLAPNLKGTNIPRYFNNTKDEIEKLASEEYSEIYRGYGEIGPFFLNDIQEIVESMPSVRRVLTEIYEAGRGKDPFFTFENGAVKLKRMPTLEDAEYTRRALDEVTTYAFERGASTAGTRFDAAATAFRNVLDNNFPDLAQVRAKWSNIQSSAEAFKKGVESLGKPSDLVDSQFTAYRNATPEQLDAYRMGVLSGIKNRMETGSRKSVMADITDPTSRLGRNIRLVYPEDSLEELLQKADIAASSQSAANTILGGSQTQITQAEASRQGSAGVGAATVIDAITGNPGAIISAATQIASRALKPRGLSDAQATQVARYLVETNPDIVKRALVDETAADTLIKLLQRIGDTMMTAATTATVKQAPAMNEQVIPGLLTGGNQ